MKKLFFIIITIITGCTLRAEFYPSKWVKFTLGDYIYDIQVAVAQDTSNNFLIAQLLDICRSNVAKQLQIKVNDRASMKKQSINGLSEIHYVGNSDYITSVELNLLKTESIYDKDNKRIYAIAYMNLDETKNYYYRRLNVRHTAVQSKLTIVEYLLQKREYIKASEEIKQIEKELEQSKEDYRWLLLLGCSQDFANVTLTQSTELFQKIERVKIELASHSELIYIQCDGYIFDMPCTKISEKIKNHLSDLACSFTDDKSTADWIIILNTIAHCGTNLNRNFVSVCISGSIQNVKNNTSYSILKEEHDSTSEKTGNYKKTAEIILNRDLLDGITADIEKILKSK